MAAPAPALISSKLYTLDANDESATIVTQVGAGPHVTNAIAEYKKLELNYDIGATAGDDFSTGNHIVRFVPGLFVKATQFSGLTPYVVPAQRWEWTITPAMVGAGPMLANLMTTLGAPFDESMKNMKVEIDVTAVTTFTINFYFFMGFDFNGWLSTLVDNHSRFLKDRYLNGTELVVGADNVYKESDRCIGSYVQINDLSATVPAYDGHDFISLQAGFYEKEVLAAAPYFTLPVWLLQVNGGAVTQLNKFTNSVIEFACTAPGGSSVDWFELYMIRTDTVNNLVDFLTNYDISHTKIITDPGVGVLHNALIKPVAGPAFAVGKWRLACTIDKDEIDIGGTYRFVVIAYNTTGPKVTSFISDPYSVTADMPFDGTMFSKANLKWADYMQQIAATEIYKGTVEERLKHRLELDYTPNFFSNDILARIGQVVTNDIRHYLKSIRLEVYRTSAAPLPYTTRKDVYFDEKLTLQPDGSYGGSAAITATGGLNTLDIEWLLRARYEDHILNLYTYFDNILQPLPLDTQDWGGKTFLVVWTLEFFYHNATTPFTDLVIKQSKLQLLDYTTENFSYTDAKTEACPSTNECFDLDLNAPADEEKYNLITTLEPTNGNSFTNKENEGFVSPGATLVQQTDSRIPTQSVLFDATGDADYCIDTSQLILDKEYKLAAIAKLNPTL